MRGQGKKKRKVSNDNSDSEAKIPRNGGSPTNVDNVNNSVSVSDSIRKANSVLFDESPLDYTDDSVSMSTNLDASALGATADVSASSNQNQNDQQTASENGDIARILKCVEGIDARVKGIDVKVSEMDTRLKKLESLEQKFGSFEIEIKKLWVFVQDTAKSSEAKSSEISDRVDNLEMSLGLANDKLTQLSKERDTMHDELLYVQSQSMRQNLIFGNLPEDPTETHVQTEAKLRQFLVEKLKLAQDMVNRLQFERVHRMGEKRPGSDRPRNVVAKFTFYKDRETVRRQRKELDGTSYSVYEQFPREVAQRRKALIPKLKEAKRQGKNAWLSYDTLYIDGKPVQRESYM